MKRVAFVVLLVACGGSKETPVSPAPTPSAAPTESVAPAASAAPSAAPSTAASAPTEPKGVEPLQVACGKPGLFVITDMFPRPKEYTLGMVAFDAATTAFQREHYSTAARGFLDAATHFAALGAQGEKNFGWSTENAILAFGMAGHVKEGQAAFADAAAHDPAHAKTLYDGAAKIVDLRCR